MEDVNGHNGHDETAPKRHIDVGDRKVVVPKYYATIRMLVDAYYDIQKERIAELLRMKGLERVHGIDEDKMRKLHEYIDEKLFEIEKNIYDQIKEELKHSDIWKYWLSGVKGVGPALGGGLVAWTHDINRFPHVSAFWAECGQGVINAGADRGRAVRRKRGEKLHFNPHMKVLVFKLGEQFVRVGGYYRKKYEEFREQYDASYKGNYECGVMHTIERKEAEAKVYVLPPNALKGLEGLPDALASVVGKKFENRITLAKALNEVSLELPIDALLEGVVESPKYVYREIPNPWLRRVQEKVLDSQNNVQVKWIWEEQPIPRIEGLSETAMREKYVQIICTDAHRYNMAKRRTVKLFLSHLFSKWKEMLGTPYEKPWVMSKLGHTHYIDPPAREKGRPRKAAVGS